jgi:hypothetical protein
MGKLVANSDLFNLKKLFIFLNYGVCITLFISALLEIHGQFTFTDLGYNPK